MALAMEVAAGSAFTFCQAHGLQATTSQQQTPRLQASASRFFAPLFVSPPSRTTRKGEATRRTSTNSRTRVFASAPLYDEFGGVKDGRVQLFEDKETFEKILADAGEKLVLVDVATKTCGPCKLIYPKYVQLSVDYPDVVFTKIFGDTSSETRALMREWGVRAVPLFRFYKNGQLIHSHTGAKVEELYRHFETHYGQNVKV